MAEEGNANAITARIISTFLEKIGLKSLIILALLGILASLQIPK